MKVVIDVSEPVYSEFEQMARRLGRSTSDLIQEAMELYVREEKPSTHSILDLQPLSVGSIHKPINSRAELEVLEQLNKVYSEPADDQILLHGIKRKVRSTLKRG